MGMNPSSPGGINQMQDWLLQSLQSGVPMEAAMPFIQMYMGGREDYLAQRAAEMQAQQQQRQELIGGLTDSMSQAALEGMTDEDAQRLLDTQLMALGKENAPMADRMGGILENLYPSLADTGGPTTDIPATTPGNFSPLYSGEQLFLDEDDTAAIDELVTQNIYSGMDKHQATTAIMEQMGLRDPTTGTWVDMAGQGPTIAADPETGMPLPAPVANPNYMAQQPAAVRDLIDRLWSYHAGDAISGMSGAEGLAPSAVSAGPTPTPQMGLDAFAREGGGDWSNAPEDSPGFLFQDLQGPVETLDAGADALLSTLGNAGYGDFQLRDIFGGWTF